MKDKVNFDNYPNLASPSTRVLFATDDWFAVCENLFLPSEPTFDPKAYTKFGKLMDGWETRRKRKAGHDWCVIQLGYEGQIRGFDIQTTFFTGNNVPAISIQACEMPEFNTSRVSQIGTEATQAQIEEISKYNTENWETILPVSKLRSGFPETCHNLFKIDNNNRYTHLRINCFPDGGIARIRVFGNVKPNWESISSPCDLALITHGGKAVAWSNDHYCSPMNLLKPGRSDGMHDGWETARNPNRPYVYKLDSNGLLNFVGKEWCIVKLGRACSIQKVVIDTNHYKGNYPESFILEYTEDLAAEKHDNVKWVTLISRAKLTPHVEESFEGLMFNENATYVRLTMIPDGGISRLRIWGHFNKEIKRKRND